jgi:hypothetical protein
MVQFASGEAVHYKWAAIDTVLKALLKPMLPADAQG